MRAMRNYVLNDALAQFKFNPSGVWQNIYIYMLN